VETAILCRLAELAREHGCRLLRGEYVPTKKNMPAAELFSQHGFTPAGAGQGLSQVWLFDLERQKLDWPTYIALEQTEAVAQG
jgi:predicted enzyme involved in methoxymalonyl-ACP biosynthesis